jgi:gliding-associated putative ABC transporter substrate-binding component GldG
MFSSTYARKVTSPVKVSANELRKQINQQNFSGGPVALGYLLEGKFTSVFRNRFLPEGVDTVGFRKEGVASKIIVIADGDLARNEINARTGQPQALGLDTYSGTTFANQELIMNMVAYLADETGLINARNKDVKIRPLDREKIKSSRLYWQVLNLVLPIVLIVLLGVAKAYLRKRRFGSFNSAARLKT